MKKLEVNIVKLKPMRVASAYGFGASPEGTAFENIQTYASANNLLNNGKLSATYGFNNPDPSPGSVNYGYEVWLPVSEKQKDTDDIEIKKFPGGLYAVARLRGLQNIGDVWQQLAQWGEDSRYKIGNHQWLEHLLTPPDIPMGKYEFDLYLPITE